jgi:putative nucleotidyltransferase with HDIG domain
MKSKRAMIRSGVFFFITALLIAGFFPHEGKFRYQFYEGKPWQYDLLMAPEDFSIYKSEDVVKAEKDSVKRRQAPYFRMDEEVKTTQIERFRARYRSSTLLPFAKAHQQYLERQLALVYEDGIVPVKDLEALKADEGRVKRVHLLRNNEARLRDISQFHTVKSAYEKILGRAPGELDPATLKSYDIDRFLVENVYEDQSLLAKILEEKYQKLSLTAGRVQAGDRIVDRGEVVDHNAYNKLRSLKIIHENKSGGKQRQSIIRGGQFVLVFGILFCCAIYMASFCPVLFFSRRHILFVLLCILTFCLLAEICVKHDLLNIYILPFAMIPIVMRTFFDSHTALFTHLITVLLCSLIAPFPHEFLILQIVAGVVVIFSLKELSLRSQLIWCALFIFGSYVLGYLSLSLYQEGDFSKIRWTMLLFFGVNLILLMFSYVLIYILEKIFGYLSPITLVELSNINTPVLKRLSETCPGTFQHSLQVSILASEAGARLGADTQLIRTGALYHDIGKMSHPAFFTENQKGGANPHQELSFEESAQIIISHVTEGVRIAEKASLPQAIIQFIRTHHGRGKTKYFYYSFKNAYPDLPVDEAAFSYPGPNPTTRETAILMMADAVEAASRSLQEYTDEAISARVHKIIDDQIADGLLKDTPLTFSDMEVIKSTFVEKLKTMYHSRISYPELRSIKN